MNSFGLSGIFSSCNAYLFTRDTPSGLGIVFYQKAMIRTGYCLWVPFYFFLIFFYYYLHVLFTSCCFWVCYRVVWLNAWERYSVCLDSTEATLCFKATFSYIFFFTRFGVMRLLFINSNRKYWLFIVNSVYVHCSRIHKLHFSATFSLKMGPTVLFTHLKIILLQCFQFSIFSFSKISYIQTDP